MRAPGVRMRRAFGRKPLLARPAPKIILVQLVHVAPATAIMCLFLLSFSMTWINPQSVADDAIVSPR